LDLQTVPHGCLRPHPVDGKHLAKGRHVLTSSQMQELLHVQMRDLLR